MMKFSANELSLNRLRPFVEIWLWRHGVVPPIAVALALAAVLAWLWLVPQQRAEMEGTQARLQEIERADRSGEAARALARAKSSQQLFRQTLAEPGNGNDLVREVFNIANEAGITVAQAEYRRVNDAHNAWSQLQIALPVKGRYASIKKFSALLLARMPALSIDQMTLRRENPNSQEVDGQIVLSVWQRPSEVAAQGEPR